jgi:glycosyltransferase involved in cell wall biosynthesis
MIEASLIIPLRNEEHYIARCLDSLLENDFPQERCEIILVDGMSDDATPDLLERYVDTYENIRVIKNPKGFTSAGLNIGIESAKGAYVFFILAHVVYAPDYIGTAIKLLKQGIADGVGAPVRTSTEGVFMRAVFAATDCLFGNGGSKHYRLNYEGYASTISSGVYRRDFIRSINGYDEDFVRVQDMELNYRIIEGGGRLYISPNLKWRYYPRTSFRTLWHRYFANGFWKYKVYKKHVTTAYWVHAVPVLFVTFLLLLACLSWVNPYYLTWLIGFAATYGFFNLFYSLLGAFKSNFSSIFILFAIFPIVHLSFGIGLLAGFLRFSIIDSFKKR